MSDFIKALSLGAPLDISQALAALLLSFVLSSLIAWVYRRTFAGFSYSRSFVHTLILGSLVTCIVLLAIGNNVARGLGMLGTLAIVRFRTPVRDPRDIIFLFATLATGIACGAMVFDIAAVGALMFCLVAFYLHASPFASRRQYEGLLRFTLPTGSGESKEIEKIFTRFCSSSHLVAMRESAQGSVVEYAHQVRLRDPSYRPDLLDALHSVEDISEVSLLMQRSTVEI